MTWRSIEPESLLDRRGVHQRQVRDTMRDDLDPTAVHAVRRRQEVGRGSGHHDGGLDAVDELAQDRTLAVGRVAKHGVERSHRRTAQCPDEVEDPLAVLATPDPVLMLDRHDVDATVKVPGGSEVVGRLVLADPVVDLERIRVARSGAMSAAISRPPEAAARSWVKVAMPQRRGG